MSEGEDVQASPAQEIERFQRWMDYQRRSVLDDNDLILPLTGPRRRGKSTLAIQMALYWDPDFDLQEQMAWSSKEYTAKARQLARGKVMILDEGIRGLMSQDGLSEYNKHLVKHATVAGSRNIIGLLLLPNLRWLTPVFREGYCEYNIRVLRRGRAVLRQLLDIEKEFVYDEPRRLFEFPFYQLPPKIEQLYRKLKDEFVEHFDDDAYNEAAADGVQYQAEVLRVLRRYGVVKA